MTFRRRRALVLLPALIAARHAGAGTPPPMVDLWIDLDLPALATLPRNQPDERASWRQRILAQQDDVMARLAQLGGRELARVQVVRNALAVRLPADQREAARQLPGVRAVTEVRDRPRTPPVSTR